MLSKYCITELHPQSLKFLSLKMKNSEERGDMGSQGASVGKDRDLRPSMVNHCTPMTGGENQVIPQVILCPSHLHVLTHVRAHSHTHSLRCTHPHPCMCVCYGAQACIHTGACAIVHTPIYTFSPHEINKCFF